MTRGTCRARADAEPALQAAIAAGDRAAETELRNTLGMVQVALGETEAGPASMQRAIELAGQDDDFDRLGTAYANLADELGHAGRGRDAVAAAQEGLAAIPQGQTRTRGWLRLVIAWHAFDAGDWALAQASIDVTWERPAGVVAIFRHLCVARLAAGIGDEDLALGHLEAVAGEVACSLEPQWIGAYGELAAELWARRGELGRAQQIAAQALDRMEVCTDDIARISGISYAALGVEADRAQRARDLADAAMRRDAVARARIHFDRIEAAAQDGGPLEAATLLQARAELARARGRATAKLWGRAAQEWEMLRFPYRPAIARWHQAECHTQHGDRAGAAAAAIAALRGAETLGSRWLTAEVRALARRARLPLGEGRDGAAGPDAASETPNAGQEDPFGLTDRERQVLALLAQGATNRRIGESLFMAEKTASVHVSRILAKLDVRSRTEAAAFAHRNHLT